jgi:hypothetical protein
MTAQDFQGLGAVQRMRAIWGLTAVLMLGACATTHASRCPVGQEQAQTAQLFLGQNVGGKATISDAAFRRYIEEELTPRFPDGLTVLDGGSQWRGEENRLIREASKVVLIVLPKTRDAPARLDAARTSYKARFDQDAVLMVTHTGCVSF